MSRKPSIRQELMRLYVETITLEDHGIGELREDAADLSAAMADLGTRLGVRLTDTPRDEIEDLELDPPQQPEELGGLVWLLKQMDRAHGAGHTAMFKLALMEALALLDGEDVW